VFLYPRFYGFPHHVHHDDAIGGGGRLEPAVDIGRQIYGQPSRLRCRRRWWGCKPKPPKIPSTADVVGQPSSLRW
jgi:hypothetical protein